MDTISNYYYPGVNKSSEIKYAEMDSNSTVNFDDFLNLMIAQLQNQDFTNPVDDAEYMAQLAQLSMVRQMQDISQSSLRSYAASLLGKVASVSRLLENGERVVDTGYVDSISFSGDEMKFMVNGRLYAITDIVQIFDPGYIEAGEPPQDPPEEENDTQDVEV
ncbi:MAG: flagellar hook assembly protein FlgD [Eubacteriales bacterium]